MRERMSVKVSSRNQIAVPRVARDRLQIKKGDSLLVDVQDGILILMPEPADFVAHFSGLGREIWQGIDTDAYLRRERDAWQHR
jgi:AbrB family looped-hinge helix DNA binding protein